MKADSPMFEGNLALDTCLYEESNKPVFIVIDGSKNNKAPVACARSRNSSSPVLNKQIAGLTIIATICIFIALSATLITRSYMARVSLNKLQTVERTVDDGESLWSIASSLHVDSYEIEDVVNRIIELNDLDSSALTPGQRLIVPTQA